ncbi:MAG: alpha-L-fucosidase [Clostridia bacterium]|nr:alpha-L-fucosidase [Clostridia bacterium]
MIIKEYVKAFEKHGFGMFVHFGLYSVCGKGEWAKHLLHIPDEAYEKTMEIFNPDPDWAKELVLTAKKAGCKYITLTTRHHDGFSLYDTLGLNEYDAPHSACKRDLVREFVDACNEEGIVPFFYHTLLDWREESYKTDFKKYLTYLRRSIEILCSQYGKIGGLWFDGMWDKPNEDWEEDALYGLIRKYQPEAMIINNTGLNALGALGHIELDSVTFERGKPAPINLENSPKYIASEMCEIFADHWGYASRDYHFKSLSQMIEELCLCRRYGSNFLLNVGPMGNGALRPLDKAMLETLGEWVAMHDEALRLPRPCAITVENDADDFLLEKDGTYYLFRHHLPMSADPNVAIGSAGASETQFCMPKKICSIQWLDDGSDVEFTQDGERVKVISKPFTYGNSLVVRIAKITTEKTGL